jgi:hypothetical protein
MDTEPQPCLTAFPPIGTSLDVVERYLPSLTVSSEEHFEDWDDDVYVNGRTTYEC